MKGNALSKTTLEKIEEIFNNEESSSTQYIKEMIENLIDHRKWNKERSFRRDEDFLIDEICNRFSEPAFLEIYNYRNEIISILVNELKLDESIQDKIIDLSENSPVIHQAIGRFIYDTNNQQPLNTSIVKILEKFGLDHLLNNNEIKTKFDNVFNADKNPKDYTQDFIAILTSAPEIYRIRRSMEAFLLSVNQEVGLEFGQAILDIQAEVDEQNTRSLLVNVEALSLPQSSSEIKEADITLESKKILSKLQSSNSHVESIQRSSYHCILY